MRPLHHWRWRSPKHLLTCGKKNGLINPYKPGWEIVTCKSCIRVGIARGWTDGKKWVDVGPGYQEKLSHE